MAEHSDTPGGDLAVGTTVVDTHRKCLARVMDPTGSKVVLRPLKGGVEWWQDRGAVRPALASDVIADRMHTAGLLSAGGAQ